MPASRYAHVANGKVDTISLWNGETDWSPDGDVSLHLLEDDSPVGPGWTFDGSAFAPPPPAVPAMVAMWQARVVLGLTPYGAGPGVLLDAIQAAIDTFEGPAKVKALAELEYAPNMRRDSEFIATLGPALGIPDSEIDALFIAAAQVS